MSLTAIADGIGSAALLIGAALSLTAAIGLLRFPDVLSRMHAATKPQVLGLLFTLLGVGLRVRTGVDVGMLLLVGAFQLLTAPVSAHLVGRAAHRTGQVDERTHTLADEYSPDDSVDTSEPNQPPSR